MNDRDTVMKKDNVFREKMKEVPPFAFNEAVASVFDDMLTRSVPLYRHSIKLQAKLTRLFYQDKTHIYDLGCSHGNFGLLAVKVFDNTSFEMIGVDSSQPMIEKYRKRLSHLKGKPNIRLFCDNIENITIENASVVVINLTLQFLDLLKRDALIEKIFQGLQPGGVLLLTEKTIHSDPHYNTLQNDFYKSFKLENGYSELEISQKRDALEKVLIPETIESHWQRIQKAGFTFFDVYLRWFNFASMIAIKDV